MKFLVIPEREIKSYNVKDIHIIISITAPKTNKAVIPFRPNCLDILYLEFYDLDKKYKDYKLISSLDAEKTWKFVTTYKDKISLIICQCEAGISRSAGIAAALSKALNGEDEYFFKHYLPNMLVYNLLLKEIYSGTDWLGEELTFITWLYKHKNFLGRLKRKDFKEFYTREEALKEFYKERGEDGCPYPSRKERAREMRR